MLLKMHHMLLLKDNARFNMNLSISARVSCDYNNIELPPAFVATVLANVCFRNGT